MLVIIVCAAVTAVGVLVFVRSRRLSPDFPSILGAVLSTVGGVSLTTCLILVPVRQAEQGAKIEEYRELQRAVDAGAPRGEMEDVYGQVVSMNRKIARARYWNDSLWCGWYFNDDFAALPSIEIPARKE